ncbi:hypothetical protein [Pseudomonas aeruginosa]|uniref:hypothetical protein n=1 Tax=Pseudomonas aeruginosa TaxID=287 RepID=UPI001EEDA051|nr:hypothetical protein [Pseudomonas aeruginosa]
MSKELNKAPVEQAGGDERAAFEAAFAAMGRPVCRADYDQDAYGTPFDDGGWTGWQARAALAQPSLMPPDRGPWHAVKWDGGRRVDLSSDDFEHDVALTVSGDFVEGDKFRYAQELAAWMNAHLAQPSPARAEQAEAERPEVVGYCNPGHIERLKQMEITGFLVHEEESASISERLMTVAQHERIVGALRAEIAEWQEAAGRGRSDVVAYIAERAKLLEGRDAALARVAELEAKLSDPTAVHQWQFSNAWFDCSEEVVLKAGKEGSPIRTLYTAPPAQAQQLHDLDKQCRDDVARALGLRPSQERGFAWSYLLASINSCVKASEDAAQAQHSAPEVSGIGRDTGHPRAVVLYLRKEPTDDDLRAIHDALRSLAAAPGKEVPQAWLDVQAERRRQITAEGWTPEHDDLYCAAELPRAAAAYILNGANDEAPAIWPFSAKWWKPRDARSNYVRAGALILAEIERLDRAAPGKEGA